MTSVLLRFAAAVALVAAGCNGTAPSEIDLGEYPDTVLVTVPMEVGSRLTLGMIGPAVEAERPLRLTNIEVIRRNGFTVVGVGAFNPDEAGSGLGVAPGWPPEGYALRAQDEVTYAVEWDGPVLAVVGLETSEPQAGLRGVSVTWVDAQGVTGVKHFDIALLSCEPEACELDEPHERERFLEELQLIESQ